MQKKTAAATRFCEYSCTMCAEFRARPHFLVHRGGVHCRVCSASIFAKHMLSISDVRHQLLAHLSADQSLSVHHVQGAHIRDATLQHAAFLQQDDQEEEEELRHLAPLRLSYADNNEVVYHTWEHLYKMAYVRNDTMHFWALDGFHFSPKAFLMLPSLGRMDASSHEITCALSRCEGCADGSGTPVTLCGPDTGVPPRGARLTPEWPRTCHQPEIRVDMEDADPPPVKRMCVADLARRINTDRIISPDLVREINTIRMETAGKPGAGEGAE